MGIGGGLGQGKEESDEGGGMGGIGEVSGETNEECVPEDEKAEGLWSV